MAYVVPQVTIHQEFTLRPLAVDIPLHAWITGPNAALFRFSEPSEKSLTLLGDYDALANVDYDYPSRPLGGIVDQSYIKLFADNPLLRYFYDPVGSGSVVLPVSSNRVRSDAVNFRYNGASYPRDGALYDRDVRAGDVVDLVAVVGGDTYALRTSVRDVIGDVVAASISAATSGTNNQATVAVPDATVAQTAGPTNCIAAVGDATDYDGAAGGDVTDVYTIEVVTSSTGGDLTTARLRVRSASGNDDANNVVPAAAGSATAVGARGLEVTFDLVEPAIECSNAATAEGISHEDLLVGQTWVVEVEQAFDAPSATSGGTYTGTRNTTYIITVTRGGDVTDASAPPQIMVSTTHGTDISGPTSVTATATGFAVGTQGVTVSFDEGVLCRGDTYYIPVVAAGVGNMRTLALNNNMPADMLDATDISVSLYLRPEAGYIEIPRNRAGSPPDVNYVLGDAGIADTGFTVNSGITVYDDSWTDGGVPLAITLNEGTLYLEYRAWLPDTVDLVGIARTLEDLDEIPGPIHPDNPLKYGVFKAITNAAGVGVMYTGVADPVDLQNWQDALSTATGDERVHAVVPMTADRAVQDLCVAHTLAQSGAEVGRERRAWFATDTYVNAAGFTVASYYLAAALAGLRSGALPNRPLTNAEIAGFDGVSLRQSRSIVVVDATTSADEETVLATVSENPDSSGQYTIVEVPEHNANFVSNGVRPGDTVRFAYTTDGWDTEIYDTYTVDAVLNEDSLRLRSGPSVPVDVPQRLEVHRTIRANDYAEAIATEAGTFGNRRIMLIHPVGDSNRGQQDTMANSGVWLVKQADTGEIVSRHTLTTAGYGDVLQQEEMIGANVDSMVRRTRKLLERYPGRVNVVDGTISLLRMAIEGLNTTFTQSVVETLGGQLRDYVIVDVRQHAVLPDRIVVEQAWLVPAPMNNLEVFSQIVV